MTTHTHALAQALAPDYGAATHRTVAAQLRDEAARVPGYLCPCGCHGCYMRLVGDSDETEVWCPECRKFSLNAKEIQEIGDE